jgi:FSR family fosmidomycin resistance protein-like MFS transporter
MQDVSDNRDRAERIEAGASSPSSQLEGSVAREAEGRGLTAAEEPALIRTGGLQTGRVVGISAAHMLNDTYTSFTAPLLPAFIAKLALSKTEAGLLSFLQSSPSLFQPLIGHLADRADLRYLVIVAPAITSTMMSLLGLAPHYSVLALLVIVAGFSSAGLHAVGPAVAGGLSGRSLGRGMGIWMVGGSLGFALGPMAVVSVVRLLGLESTPWLMIGGWGASAFLFWRLRDVPTSLRSSDDLSSWREGVRDMAPILTPMAGITVARALMVAATTIFLPTFLTEQGASLWFGGVSLSLYQLAGVGGALLGGSLSDRFGRRLVLLGSVVGAPLLMFVFLAAGLWVRVPVLLALGIASSSTQPVLMALVQEHSPANRALATGIYHSLAFLTEALGAVAVGALGDLLGLPVAFSVSAVALLLGLPLIPMVPRRRGE